MRCCALNESTQRTRGVCGRSEEEGVTRRAALALLSASAPSALGTTALAEDDRLLWPERGGVWFANGCFWGRQKSFVDCEINSLNRSINSVSAVVGYAGGRNGAGELGKVCYFTGPRKSHYESPLGHCEAVRVSPTSADEFATYATTFFSQFVRVPGRGMGRSDPQDQGSGYRSSVGIPGGINGMYFPLLQKANVHGMQLREGSGNDGRAHTARANDADLLNVVWVLDSNVFPFYQAEHYHQCHDGVGEPFPAWYKRDVKQSLEQRLLTSTGCPDL